MWLHHKNNNNHSTANHDNPQHQKPGHMHFQYGKNDLPNPQRPQKRSVLNRIRERFQEKPATPEEVRQLGLNAKRETYKTQIQKAKSSRPSRFDNIMGGGGRQPSYRRGSKYAPQDSGLFGGGSAGSWLESGNGPSFDFITGGGQQRGRRSSSNDNGFTGKGLSDLF